MNSAAIDPGFRPADYWDPTDPVALILANIKGAQRRAGVRDAIDDAELLAHWNGREGQ